MPIKHFAYKNRTSGYNINAIKAPTRKGERICITFPKNEIVASRLPINLYITMVPITNNSAYTTIVKYLLFGVKWFLCSECSDMSRPPI